MSHTSSCVHQEVALSPGVASKASAWDVVRCSTRWLSCFLQPVLCGLLRMLVDGMGSQSFELFALDEDILFFALVQGRDVYLVMVGMFFSPAVMICIPVFCTLASLLLWISCSGGLVHLSEDAAAGFPLVSACFFLRDSCWIALFSIS